MSEAMWLRSSSPHALVSVLQNLNSRGLSQKVLARKFRLFACACCRRVWELLEPASRSAVEVAERFADGQATQRALVAAYESAYAPIAAADHSGPYLPAASAAQWSCVPATTESNLIGLALHGSDQTMVAEGRARRAGLFGAEQRRLAAGGGHVTRLVLPLEDDSLAWQCRVLHDLFGNPFRPVRLAPSWLNYDSQLVVRIARGIHEDRAFDSLPILADALEEAGCVEQTILDHCRQPAEHFRGCWVIDQCLGWG